VHGDALLILIVIVLAGFETWRRNRHRRGQFAIVATLWKLWRNARRRRRLR
jgi:hypothetical protein